MYENEYESKLIDETSIYLKAHLDNPIEWHPWGKEALEKAKLENKLIFLSIGYSSCHWCHVMRNETFSSIKVAELLNANFISIIVDREEHYDVDTLYMNAAFISNGKGGWPLNAILTPDANPFYVNTYMPKLGTPQIPGFINVIEKSAYLWKLENERILNISKNIESRLFEYSNPVRGSIIDENIFSKTIERLFDNWDEENGGILSENKFPAVHNLFFLLNHGGEKPIEYVKNQINNMLDGGIYDRLEGGFHRYTTDREWRIPHFDKHLHDQASMLGLITELYLYTGEEKYKEVSNKTFDFIKSRFLSSDNLFFTSIDSDVNNNEGLYYLWDYSEMKLLLDPVEFEYAKEIFNISKSGNYNVKDSGGKNILYIDKNPLDTFIELKIMYDLEKYKNHDELYNSIIKKLSEARSKRTIGEIDHKILLDLNCYVGAALIYYARVFDRNDIYEMCELLYKKLKTDFVKDDYLIHCYRNEKEYIQATLIDYAYYMLFLINMYQYKGKSSYIAETVRIMDIVISNFWDGINYGFFDTDIRFNNVKMRYKQIYNTSVVPSNAIMMNVLIKLYEITNDQKYYVFANNMGFAFSNEINKNPLATISLISSLSKIKRGSYVVSMPSEVSG